MKEIADIMTFRDGSKMWEAVFEKFAAKVYIPVTKQPAGIVNFGFRAPYLMIFEENRFIDSLIFIIYSSIFVLLCESADI